MLRLAACLMTAGLAVPAAAQRSPEPDAGIVVCESRDGREQFCPADTRGGVVLLEALAGRCTLGRTWGYEGNGIWVRGCSGRFALEHGSAAVPPGTIACSSFDERYTLCPADTRGGVRLVRQRSRAACFEGRTWGHDRRGIWVDEGCAAEFELLGAGTAERRAAAAAYDDPRLGRTFVCESRDGRRRLCPVELDDGLAATVVRNISAEPCEEGRNWGYDRRGVWVDDGCRAEFRLIARDTGTGPAGPGEELTTIVCESRGFARRVCPTDPARSVRLTRQLSDTPCRERDNWGWERRAIWVDRGCAAEFTLYR